MSRFPLTYGSRDPLVVDVQRNLKACGFDPGPIDGVLGPKTLLAVDLAVGTGTASQPSKRRTVSWVDAQAAAARALYEFTLPAALGADWKARVTAEQDALLTRVRDTLTLHETPIGTNKLNVPGIVSGYYDEDTLIKLGHPPWCGLYADWLLRREKKAPWGTKKYGAGFQIETYAEREKILVRVDVHKHVARALTAPSGRVRLLGSLLLLERAGSGSDKAPGTTVPVGKSRPMHVAVILGVEQSPTTGKVQWVTVEGNVGDRVQVLRRSLDAGALVDLSEWNGHGKLP